MGEKIVAQVGDDSFAKRHHQEIARRGGQRQQADDADHGKKIGIDDARVVGGEAPVDHAAHGQRHGQGGRGGDRQGCQRAKRPAEPAAGIGQDRGEGAEGIARGAALLGGVCHLGNIGTPRQKGMDI